MLERKQADWPEMKCYCQNPQYTSAKGKTITDCDNFIPYMHHHEWGAESDFMCASCVDKCGEFN